MEMERGLSHIAYSSKSSEQSRAEQEQLLLSGASVNRVIQTEMGVDRSAASLRFLIVIFPLLTVLLATGSYGSPSGNRKTGKSSSSVFSLFNLNAKSRFWSESVIHGGADFDDLESSSPGKMGAINYTKAETFSFELQSKYFNA
ncbi:unnamed protein product [Dovyalis caffra]|uniref:Uncharacterized protein n=1 Tax=Dovyalis caffra TaxID=77055 RepID=A0AAV1S6H4_9ROSI|nr:unnamed protein product [Dovyalis caffra]